MNIDRAIRRAAAAGAAVVGRGRTQEEVSALVERIERHPDGYLHARIVVEGRRFYFHRKYGSWLAPGNWRGHAVQKEPEALLGSTLGGEVKYELSRRSQPFDIEEAKRRAQEQSATAATAAPHDAGRDDAAERADGVPDGGDQDDAAPDIPPD